MNTKWSKKERITSGMIGLISYNLLLMFSIAWQFAFAFSFFIAVCIVQLKHVNNK